MTRDDIIDVYEDWPGGEEDEYVDYAYVCGLYDRAVDKRRGPNVRTDPVDRAYEMGWEDGIDIDG
jgi:hypothetical protein